MSNPITQKYLDEIPVPDSAYIAAKQYEKEGFTIVSMPLSEVFAVEIQFPEFEWRLVAYVRYTPVQGVYKSRVIFAKKAKVHNAQMYG